MCLVDATVVRMTFIGSELTSVGMSLVDTTVVVKFISSELNGDVMCTAGKTVVGLTFSDSNIVDAIGMDELLLKDLHV